MTAPVVLGDVGLAVPVFNRSIGILRHVDQDQIADCEAVGAVTAVLIDAVGLPGVAAIAVGCLVGVAIGAWHGFSVSAGNIS